MAEGAQQDTVIFEDVTSVDVNTKNGASKKYNLVTTDGKRFETWDKETAVKAAKSKGQTTKVTYRVEKRTSKDGERTFTNYKVIDLEPTGEAVIDAAVDALNTAIAEKPEIVRSEDRQAAKDARIARQVAFKGAVELIAQRIAAGDDPNVVDATARLTDALVPVVEGAYDRVEHEMQQSADAAVQADVEAKDSFDIDL